jgi:hypothetical protein
MWEKESYPQVCELPIKIVYSRGEFGEWIGKALA